MAEDPERHWTSDTRDAKLRTLLDRKQDDAENAKLLIDLLENGVFRADASGDSDSDNDDDDDSDDDSDNDSDDNDVEFEDTDSYDSEVPLGSWRPALRPDDMAFLRSRRAAPARPLAVSELEERHHGVSVYGSPARTGVAEQGPPTVYELVEVVERPQLRVERVADVETVPVRQCPSVEVDRQDASLKEEEREVRELERQLRERKARMEEIWREREIGRTDAFKADHNPAAMGVQTAHRRGWFSQVKSRFSRLFSRTESGGKKKDGDRDLSATGKSPDDEPVGQHNLISPTINTLLVVNNNLAPPNGTQDTSSPPPAAKPTPSPPKISASEALLRTKIFAPHTLALTTTLPEPAWATPPDPTGITTLFTPTATPLTRHTLLPQGQFIAQRQRDVTDALSKIELGLGVTGPGGIGVNATTTGILGLLKPYQWINMWRGTEREMYTTTAEKDMDALHALENELISPAKYHFGESEFLTVVTHSSDVNSGAVALFRAALVDGLATRLTLEARFKDVPREICKILRRGVKPNRYELMRAGRALKCSKGGGEGVLPPCLAVVARDGEGGWEGVGGGWRRALRIMLGEGEGTGPREGLVATVPQMVAFLHLTQRVVDYVPSTPVFSFEPPLVGMADDGACRVRRGTKLLGQPGGAVHVGEEVTISVLFSKESRWVREQLLWA